MCNYAVNLDFAEMDMWGRSTTREGCFCLVGCRSSDMSHTHRRDAVSDFSIERILAKETVTSAGGRLPLGGGGGGDKVEWVSGACKLRDDRSDGDRGMTERTAESSVETAKQTPNVDPTQINEELSWLRCTRYHPPKLPRKSCVNKHLKRKPGTHPRIPFTKYQLDTLEEKYKSSAYLSRKDVVYLSEVLQLPQSRIKIWFQNRRARERRESQTFTQTQTSGS